MSWQDESWKDSYDAWKLASTDTDLWDIDDEPCDHDDYSIDVLTGRAECDRCPHSWWATAEQCESEMEHQAAYGEWVAEQERPWNRFKEWVRDTRVVSWWRLWRWRRKWPTATVVDEIPF